MNLLKTKMNMKIKFGCFIAFNNSDLNNCNIAEMVGK